MQYVILSFVVVIIFTIWFIVRILKFIFRQNLHIEFPKVDLLIRHEYHNVDVIESNFSYLPQENFHKSMGFDSSCPVILNEQHRKHLFDQAKLALAKKIVQSGKYIEVKEGDEFSYSPIKKVSLSVRVVNKNE